MNALLALVGVSLTGAFALAAVYAYAAVVQPRHVVRARVARGGPLGLRSVSSVLRDDVASRLRILDALPLSQEARARMQLEIDRAGKPLRVKEYLALRVGAAFLTAILVFAVLSVIDSAPRWLAIVGLATGVVPGWLLPRLWLRRGRRRRRRAIEQQLPDALTAMAKALRAGTGLLQALAYSAEETPAPLGTELKDALRDLQLGADATDVLTAMAERVDCPDLDIAVTAIVIQRAVGGNLSEILSNVANTIREREGIRRELSVLTARHRLTANLTAVLPVLVAVAFILINRDLGRLLVTTTAGQVGLAIGLFFEALGIVVVRRLASIEV